MEYGKIIAVTGMPGLYEMLSSKGDGAIVRSLDDQSTKFVSGRVHNFTHLESIEVYTEKENVNLVEVLNAMKSSNEKFPDEKDGKAITAYFQKVYPQLDFDRVYTSDMKKMIKWLEVLKRNNVEIKISEPEPEPEVEEEPVEETPVEKAPKKKEVKGVKEVKEVKEEKKPATKKAAPKKEAEEKKPAAKKAATKK
ncbi:MAG TPA: DUF5606 domain-containing protein, partial [Chitinophagaceae bacterium]|nr:DUF5606 domain-containing protein [Chitinophagaceae bacterium]